MAEVARDRGVILIIDDEPDSLTLLARVLRGAGYGVRAAIRGSEALSSAQRHPPDLVLLDIRMPGMDGYEVCRRLKALECTRQVPVLFLSAREDVSDKVEAFQVGGVDYITKPFQREEVLARVATHVTMRRMQQQLAKYNAELEEIVLERTADIEATTRQLKDRERLYRLLADNVRDVIWVLNTDLKPTYYSPSVLAQRGYSVEEMLQASLEDILTKTSYFNILGMFDELKNDPLSPGYQEGRVVELQMRKKDGTIFWAETHLSRMLGEDGCFSGFIGVTRDISKRKLLEAEREELERQLIRRQRLESLGTLAGGIAHDFNNLLSAIVGYTRMTLDDAPQAWEHREYLEGILRASGRATDLVEQILTFSRPAKEERRSFELRLIINEALRLLRAALPKTVELRQNLDTRALILGDPSAIHQLVMNICTNAALAVGDRGGVIDVSLSEVDLKEDDVKFLPGLAPGPHLRLSVRDTGCGISEEYVDRIFEPFFTTREEGKGTGLGLAVVHGIVVSHGGAIAVDTLPGQGTCFDVYLPRVVDSIAAETASRELLSCPAGGGENVLFVDDEEDLACLGKHMLERLGYRVTALTSSREALAEFRRNPDRYDVVITDMSMPHMTGHVLARKLRAVRSGVQVILCTGYASEELLAMTAKSGIQAVIRKPLSGETLALKVQELLSRRMRA